jgi:hypothetical protein
MRKQDQYDSSILDRDHETPRKAKYTKKSERRKIMAQMKSVSHLMEWQMIRGAKIGGT